MKLLSLAMRQPSEQCIYAPSKLRPSIEIDEADFETDFKERIINVSLHPDGLSNSRKMTVYSEKRNPMTGWFIVE